MPIFYEASTILDFHTIPQITLSFICSSSYLFCCHLVFEIYLVNLPDPALPTVKTNTVFIFPNHDFC